MGWVVNATPRPIYPRKDTWYPLYRRLGGPQGRSGQVQKISPPPGLDPLTVQPVASRYTDCARATYKPSVIVIIIIINIIIISDTAAQLRLRPPRITRFLHYTKRRATVGRTSLDEWSARRRDLYMTTHNTHNRKTSMPPVGFEPMIAAGERS
jgi:hypothetical protein